jgi:hypothetical protein
MMVQTGGAVSSDTAIHWPITTGLVSYIRFGLALGTQGFASVALGADLNDALITKQTITPLQPRPKCVTKIYTFGNAALAPFVRAIELQSYYDLWNEYCLYSGTSLSQEMNRCICRLFTN